MAMNVNIDGLHFDGPDKEVSIPSWDFIMTQVKNSLDPLCAIIGGVGGINSDLSAIDAKLAEWAEDTSTPSIPSNPVDVPIPGIGDLIAVIQTQAGIIASMKNHITAIESIGGGGNASFTDYVSNKDYERNNVVVDPDTETCYRVLEDYTSDTIEHDVQNLKLKLLAAEGQVISVAHAPSASEIANYPEDALIAVYSKTSTHVPE